MKTFFLATGIFAFIILNISCKKYGPEISNFDKETHNAGNSCMECHKKVLICGTVYNTSNKSNPSNIIVKLLTSPDKTGIVKTTLEVDKSGNFYTTSKTIFKGLYPVVEYSNGTQSQYMKSSINSGDCNLCHQENEKIYIK